MKLSIKNLIASSIVLALVGFFCAMVIQNPFNAVASVSQGSDYKSQMATSGLASASVSKALTAQTFGSVIITASSTGNNSPFRIWDATSTATSTYQSEDKYSTTTTYGRLVASFAPGIQPLTYTFDASLFKGIVIETPIGFNGSYVVTYR